MSQEDDDHLNELLKASAKKKSSPAGARQRAAQKAQQRSRSTITTSIIWLVILGAGAGGLYVVFQNLPKEPPAVVEQPKPPPPPPTVSEVVVDKRKEVAADWDQITRTFRPTPGFKGLLDRGNEHQKKMDSSWESKRYAEATESLEELRKVIAAVRDLDAARGGGVEARANAVEMATNAEAEDAPQMVPTFWDEASVKLAKADRQYLDDQFIEAISGWQGAGDAFGRATTAAGKAKMAATARKRFELDLVRRFNRATVDLYGAEPLKKAMSNYDSGIADYTALKFDESKAKFEAADKLVPDVEFFVQRKIGAHYYAVQAGYRAAAILFKRALGGTVAEAAWKELGQSVADLGLPPETVSAAAAMKDPKYAELSAAIMDGLSDAITKAHSEAVQKSFAVGVQFRIVEQLLQSDADTFAKQDSTEIRRTIGVINQLSSAAGYPETISEPLKKLNELLATKPEYEAMRKSRDHWAELLRTLDDFDRGMKYLPYSAEVPGAGKK